MEFFVALYTVVGSQGIGRNYGTINGRAERLVRATDRKANEIFAITSVLRRFNRFVASEATLDECFVASAPRRCAEVITMVVGRVCRVTFYPFIRVAIVAIITFNGVPFIGQFGRRRGSRFVAWFGRFQDQRVVQYASDVAARVLRGDGLVTRYHCVSDYSRQAWVVVVACALRFPIFSIRMRAFVNSGFGTTSARTNHVNVCRLVVYVSFEGHFMRQQIFQQPRFEYVCSRILFGQLSIVSATNVFFTNGRLSI